MMDVKSTGPPGDSRIVGIARQFVESARAQDQETLETQYCQEVRRRFRFRPCDIPKWYLLFGVES